MSIYDDARALGKAILECDEAKKVYEAREAFEANEEAKALIDEYTELKSKWDAVMTDKDADKAPLAELGEKIVAKEKEIRETPATFNLLQAESQFGAYVNSIFSLISSTIQGTDAQQSGCDPSCCSSCGGGCH